MATKQKFPKTIGEAIDQLYGMREARLDLSKKVDEMKSQEAALSEYITTQFEKSKIDGAKGDIATAAIKRSVSAKVEDWDKFVGYVVKNKAFDLLHRRVTVEAAKARWTEGKEIPGVSQIPVESLSVSKR